MAITRPFPGAFNLSTPARRVAAVTAAGAAVFWVVAFAFVYATTELRHRAFWADFPAQKAAYERWQGLDGRGATDELAVGSVGSHASSQLGAIVGHVTTITLAFAAVLALISVLVAHRRSGYAVVAAVATTVGVALGAGPIALLTGTIRVDATSIDGIQVAAPGASAAERAFVDYQNTYVAFGTPVWWQVVVAAGVGVLLAAFLLVLRRVAIGSEDTRPVSSVPAVVTTAVTAVFLVAVGLAGLGETTTGDEYYGSRVVAALLVTYLGLGVAAVVAGLCLARGRRSLGPALALTGLIAVSAFFMWSTHHVGGGGEHVFGWLDMGDDAPPIETPMLAAALLLAVPIGWVSGTIAAQVTRRASGAPLVDTASVTAAR